MTTPAEEKVALWKKDGKNGEFFAGKMSDGRSVTMFLNKFKEKGDNKPTYQIYIKPAADKKSDDQYQPKLPNFNDVPF